MSTFNANDFGRDNVLTYRSAPAPVYRDPLAEKLAVWATTLVVLAWLAYWMLELFPDSNTLFLLSLSLGTIATFCAVGAMLERHIPPFAWLASACLLGYWLMILVVAFKAMFAIIMA